MKLKGLKYCFILLAFSVILIITACDKNNPEEIADNNYTDVKIEADVQIENDDSTKLEGVIENFIKDKQFSASVLVAKEGKIVFSKGYGMADYDNKIANGVETKYFIASMTKPITAIAIMQLYEKGQLDLNDKVSKYIPGITIFDKITIHQLLTHTSGLPTDISYFTVEKPGLEGLNELKNKTLQFEPGSRYRYCNTGYYVLGYIIEKVSGISYKDYIESNIFEPLKMVNTGCNGTVENLAKGYSNYQDSLYIENIDMSKLFSAGSVYSNVEDLFLLDKALYSETILKKSSIEKMDTPWTATENDVDYRGYGWVISKIGTHTYLEHGGLTDGYNSYFSRRIDDRSMVVILCNISNPNVGTRELVRLIFENI